MWGVKNCTVIIPTINASHSINYIYVTCVVLCGFLCGSVSCVFCSQFVVC